MPNCAGICRFCGDGTAQTLVSLYENTFNLLEKADKYLPMRVKAAKTTDVAEHCCVDCVNTICNWDTFYKRCEEVEQQISLMQANVASGEQENVATFDNSSRTTDSDGESEIEKAQCNGSDERTQKRFFKTRQQKLCYFCEFIATSTKDHKDHLLNEHCNLIFCCNICDSYLPRLQLMPHMTEHAYQYSSTPKNGSATSPSNSPAVSDTTAKFKCEKCNQEFRSISGIKYHMNAKHVQLQVFECPTCTCKFSSKRVLENHKRSMHGRQARSYSCKHCRKTFKTDSTLYTHEKLHSAHRPFECKECGKSFRLKHHLTGHTLTQHTNVTADGTKDLPFECSCCHKKFAAADNLRKHKKTHDLTVDFACHICGAKMRQKRYLRQHMRKVHLQSLTSE